MEVTIMLLKKLIGMVTVFTLTILLSACNIGAAAAPTPDVGLVYTQAAQLVATQFALQQTQTALAIPPTALPTSTPPAIPSISFGTPFGASTPFGGSTPFGASTPFGVATQPGGFIPTATIRALGTTSGPKCDDAQYIADLTVPDGTIMKPGQDFDKVWRIKNTGTCTWDDGYALVYQGGSLDGYNVKIKTTNQFVKAGETYDFGVHLTASLVPNTYTECWTMMNDKGYYFGQSPVACVSIVVQK